MSGLYWQYCCARIRKVRAFWEGDLHSVVSTVRLKLHERETALVVL